MRTRIFHLFILMEKFVNSANKYRRFGKVDDAIRYSGAKYQCKFVKGRRSKVIRLFPQ